jgi:hypothetical protein
MGDRVTGSEGAMRAGQRLQGGDERGGFEVSADKGDGLLSVKLWGIWRFNVTKEFCAAVVGCGKELSGKPWSIVADARQFDATTPDIARMRLDAMSKAKSLGCEKVGAIVSSVGYSRQFMQLAEESRVGGAVFVDEKSALEWIYESRPRPKSLP